MDDSEVNAGHVLFAAIGAAILVAGAACSALLLLRSWDLAPGGQTGSAALVNTIPQPRLQTAPQLGRKRDVFLPEVHR
jgi:hypothetical protein